METNSQQTQLACKLTRMLTSVFDLSGASWSASVAKTDFSGLLTAVFRPTATMKTRLDFSIFSRTCFIVAGSTCGSEKRATLVVGQSFGIHLASDPFARQTAPSFARQILVASTFLTLSRRIHLSNNPRLVAPHGTNSATTKIVKNHVLFYQNQTTPAQAQKNPLS